MKSRIRSSDPEAIDKLQTEIHRLKASQKMMRDANAALLRGDDQALRALGFSEEHIAELKREVAGQIGFPESAFGNNDRDIRHLKRRIAKQAAREAHDGDD